jgi:hypothetical protein
MAGPDLAQLLHEVAAGPQPPTRLDSAALFAAGRRRRRTVSALRTAAAAVVLAVVAVVGTGAAASLNHRADAPVAMPGAAYLSELPAVVDQPGALCRDRVTAAVGRLAEALPVGAPWIPGYTTDCAGLYVRMTANAPHAIHWMVLMTVKDTFPQPDPCTERSCRQTMLGPLNWGTGSGGFYGDPPGQIGVGLTYAGIDRVTDGTRIQVFEWLTYPSSRAAPASPHSPEILGDALLLAAQRL